MSAPYHYSPASSSDHTVSDPRAAYQARLDNIAVREKKLQRRDQRFVRLRVAIFIFAVGLAILCLGEPEFVSWWWITIPALLFCGLKTDKVLTAMGDGVVPLFSQTTSVPVHRSDPASVPAVTIQVLCS